MIAGATPHQGLPDPHARMIDMRHGTRPVAGFLPVPAARVSSRRGDRRASGPMEMIMIDRIGLTRRGAMGLAAGAALAASVPAPAGAAAPATKPVRGGKLVFGRYADSLFLDGVQTELNVDIWVLCSIYDTLLLPTSDGLGLKAGLATKWDWSDGGKTLTVALRQGVKFSDGTPLTADDVKWSIDRARDPKEGAWNSLLGSVDSVNIADPATIVFKLKHPDPTLLPVLATFNTGILPSKKFMAAAGTTLDEKAKAFAEKPIGSGPFMVTDWQRGVSMKLARNPYHWNIAADGKPLPYLDELEFQIIPDDATRLLKLKAGELGGSEFIPYARVAELKADPGLDMQLWPSTKINYLTMNVRPTLKNGAANPLSNLKVRQAINHAINKDALIAVTTRGLGKPMKSMMSSKTPLMDGTAPPYPYDVAKAKALLAQSGVAPGFELSCMTLAGSADEISNMTAIQQMLAAIGIKLKIEQLDNATRNARYKSADFQMRNALWTDDLADPSEIGSYILYSPTVQSLHSGWKSDRVDTLFLASQEEIDIPKRRAQYKEMQDIYKADAPMVFMYESPYPVAFRKNVKGFLQIPLGNNYFNEVYIEA
jgi:peptide/nickel transport system substrate-binding protein